MGNAQRAQAEIDIAASRQVIRAQIEALLTNFPTLKDSPEGLQASQEAVVGAAAQSAPPNSTQTVANNSCATWIPRLRCHDPSFHHFIMPCDDKHGAAAQSISQTSNEQSQFLHESEVTAYQEILQDKSCYRPIQTNGGSLDAIGPGRAGSAGKSHPNYMSNINSSIDHSDDDIGNDHLECLTENPTHEKFFSNSHPECLTDSTRFLARQRQAGTIRGTPQVSQKWADLRSY